MKERPILFRPEMVRAIMAGEKTQTRRTITKSRSGPCDTSRKIDLDWSHSLMYPNNPFGVKLLSKIDSTVHRVYPPYESGSHLWVKETFRPIMKDIRDPGSYERIATVVDYYEYKADKQPHIQELIKWENSIFMPREASRITIEVEEVLVERLNGISKEDTYAEGVDGIMEFFKLWESINGPGSWEANPWVWVLHFKKI